VSDFIFAILIRIIKLSVCKGSEIFQDVQEKSHLGAIFMVWGVKEGIIFREMSQLF
jgi:hypothetical protein